MKCYAYSKARNLHTEKGNSENLTRKEVINMRNDSTTEYKKGRRNMLLRKANELDALSDKLDMPRNVVMDLLIEYFGDPLVHACDVARNHAQRTTTPEIKLPDNP